MDLKDLHGPLHGRAKRDPKATMLYLQSLLRKGVSLGHVGRNQNLKDLKDHTSLKALYEWGVSNSRVFLTQDDV